MSLRWKDLPRPTIAQVHGLCIFGGWKIASAMDIIVASEDARFLPGPPQWMSLPWDIGPRRAKALLLDDQPLSAQEACELGIVYKVFAREDLDRPFRSYDVNQDHDRDHLVVRHPTGRAR
jgi:enoyl-CoA hydratase/carnithine racemase